MRWSRNATSSALTAFTRATHSRSILSLEIRGIGFPAIRGSTTGMISSHVVPYCYADARSSDPLRSGRDLELVARHLGQIDTLDPDQARVTLAPRRVQIALVVKIRGSGGELVR